MNARLKTATAFNWWRILSEAEARAYTLVPHDLQRFRAAPIANGNHGLGVEVWQERALGQAWYRRFALIAPDYHQTMEATQVALEDWGFSCGMLSGCYCVANVLESGCSARAATPGRLR